MTSASIQKLADLLYTAAKKRFLKKAVFSKSSDNDTIRAVATLFEKSGTVMVQIEYFKKDGKALHKNLELGSEEIFSIISEFSQINLIGDGAEAEYRKSKSNN